MRKQNPCQKWPNGTNRRSWNKEKNLKVIQIYWIHNELFIHVIFIHRLLKLVVLWNWFSLCTAKWKTEKHLMNSHWFVPSFCSSIQLQADFEAVESDSESRFFQVPCLLKPMWQFISMIPIWYAIHLSRSWTVNSIISGMSLLLAGKALIWGHRKKSLSALLQSYAKKHARMTITWGIVSFPRGWNTPTYNF